MNPDSSDPTKNAESGSGQDDPAAPSWRTAISMLPPDVGYYMERRELVEQLDALEVDTKNGRGVVALITGMGGIGKTALAVHWSRALSDDFPDGQIYLNLRGYDPTLLALSPEQALDRLLDALRIRAPDGSSFAERAALYRASLVERQVLILLDNAKDAAQVRPLLPGSARCLVVVTSRDNLIDLAVRDGARAIPIDRWSVEELRALWRVRRGLENDTNAEAVSSIIDFCAGLPLALSLAAAQSAVNKDSRVEQLAQEMRSWLRPLDAFTVPGDTDDLRATFTWSYRALSKPTARLFRLISTHPGPAMSLTSIASLSDLSVEDARALTSELVSLNMLTRSSTDFFVLHDLLRALGLELVGYEEKEAAAARLLDHYIRTLRNATLSLGRGNRLPLATTLKASTGVQKFSSTESSMDSTEWYEEESQVLETLFYSALERGLDREAILLELDSRPFRYDLYPVSLTTAAATLDAAVRLGDPQLLADTHRYLFRVHILAAVDPEAGWEHAYEAARLFADIGDDAGASATYRNMSSLARREGATEDAVRYASLSADAARRLDDGPLLALATAELIMALVIGGDNEEAIVLSEEAIDLSLRFSPITEQYVREALGIARFQLGDLRGALDESLAATAGPYVTYVGDLGSLALGADAASRLGELELAQNLVAAFRVTAAAHPDLAKEIWGEDWEFMNARAANALTRANARESFPAGLLAQAKEESRLLSDYSNRQQPNQPPDVTALYIQSRVALYEGDDKSLESLEYEASRMMIDGREPARSQGHWIRSLTAERRGLAEEALHLARPFLLHLQNRDPLVRAYTEASDVITLVRMAIKAGDSAAATAVVTLAVEASKGEGATPLVRAIGLHAAGLLEGSRASLEEALALFELADRPISLASALEDLAGLTVQTHRSEAIELYRRAHAIYARVGAFGEQHRVLRRLDRLGVRREQAADDLGDPAWDSLSAAQREVVTLVVEGLSNRQVAEKLFLSPHTVNSHLRFAFSKLSVHSRVELARVYHRLHPSDESAD